MTQSVKATVADKVLLELPDLARKLKAFPFPGVDVVVGVGTGGIVPASLVAYELERPLYIIQLNYRAPDNTPQRSEPELLSPFVLMGSQRVLLVDDVCVTGQTLTRAKESLTGHSVTSFVLKGRADLVLLPDLGSCIALPWRDF